MFKAGSTGVSSGTHARRCCPPCQLQGRAHSHAPHEGWRALATSSGGYLPSKLCRASAQAGQNLFLLLFPMHSRPLSPQPVYAMAPTLIAPAAMSSPFCPLQSGPPPAPQGLARCQVGAHLRKSRRGRVVVGIPSAGQLRKWNCVRVRVSCDCTFFR